MAKVKSSIIVDLLKSFDKISLVFGELDGRKRYLMIDWISMPDINLQCMRCDELWTPHKSEAHRFTGDRAVRTVKFLKEETPDVAFSVEVL